MPLVRLHTSVPVAVDQRATLLKGLSAIAAECIGKPEAYVMAALSDGPMCMAGQIGPAAFVDVRSIGGLTGDVNRRLSERICALLEKSLSVEPSRVFLTFTDVAARNWGFDGNTFG